MDQFTLLQRACNEIRSSYQTVSITPTADAFYHNLTPLWQWSLQQMDVFSFEATLSIEEIFSYIFNHKFNCKLKSYTNIWLI